MSEISILAALITKHFICDFPLQTSYQHQNKGNYGHPGGLLHATIHGLGTSIALLWFVPLPIALAMALLDGIIHYHIDWAKNKINRRYDLKSAGGPSFWITFGLDQYLHCMTYILIVYLLKTNAL